MPDMYVLWPSLTGSLAYTHMPLGRGSWGVVRSGSCGVGGGVLPREHGARAITRAARTPQTQNPIDPKNDETSARVRDRRPRRLHDWSCGTRLVFSRGVPASYIPVSLNRPPNATQKDKRNMFCLTLYMYMCRHLYVHF